MSIVLDSAQIRFLRGLAHSLKAWLQIGEKGLSEAFIAELNEVLQRHELVKVKVTAEDRHSRQALIDELLTATGSALVQRIGHVAVLYRPAKDKQQPSIILPQR